MAVKVVHEKSRVEDLGTTVSIMSSRRGLRRRIFHYTVMIIHYPAILNALSAGKTQNQPFCLAINNGQLPAPVFTGHS